MQNDSGTLPQLYKRFFGVAGFSLKLRLSLFRDSRRAAQMQTQFFDVFVCVFVCFCNMALAFLVAQRRDLADTHYYLRSHGSLAESLVGSQTGWLAGSSSVCFPKHLAEQYEFSQRNEISLVLVFIARLNHSLHCERRARGSQRH